MAQLLYGACLELLVSGGGSAPDFVRDRYRAIMAAGCDAARARVQALVARRVLEGAADLPVLQRLTIAATSDSAVIRLARSADISRVLLQGGLGLKGALSRLGLADQAAADAILEQLTAAAGQQPCKRKLWLELRLRHGSPSATLSLFQSPPAPLVQIATLRALYHGLVGLQRSLGQAVAARSRHLSAAELQDVAEWLAAAHSEAAPPAGPQFALLVALARMCRALEHDTAQRARGTAQSSSGRLRADDDDDDDAWEEEMEEAEEGGEVSGARARGSCSTVRGAASAVAASLAHVLQRHVADTLVRRLRAPEGGVSVEARLLAMCRPSVLQHAAQAELRVGFESALRQLARDWLAELGGRFLTPEGPGPLLDLLRLAGWAATVQEGGGAAAREMPVRARGLGDSTVAALTALPPVLLSKLATLIAGAALGAARELPTLGGVCTVLEHAANTLGHAASLAAALNAAARMLPSAAAAGGSRTLDVQRVAQLAATHGGVPGMGATLPGGMVGKAGRRLAMALLRAVADLGEHAAGVLAKLLPPKQEPPRALTQREAMAIAVEAPGAEPIDPWQTGVLHLE